MAIHWQIKFRSERSNTLFTVNIYDDNYTGSTPVQLEGAAQPFVTNEDNNDDWFSPIRTQSGYLRIADTGYNNDRTAIFDWKDLIPETNKSRKVTITSNGSIYWQGYLQPQTFSGMLYSDIQEREFPLACPITVLKGIDTDTTKNGVVNFAYILQYLLQQTGLTFAHINFQGSDAVDWLLKRVDWENFIETDENEGRIAKYDCYQILEEICKFFGWTCRTFMDEIYFVCPDDTFDTDFIYLTNGDLYDLASGHSVQQPQSFNWLPLNTDRDIYASTDNNIEIMRGYKSIKISADINKQNIITELPYSFIQDHYIMTVPTPTDMGGGNSHHFVLNGARLGFVYNYQDLLVNASALGDYLRGYFQTQEYYDGTLAYKHNYDYYTSLNIMGNAVGTFYENDQLLRVKFKHNHNYDHGVIAISGDISSYNGEYNGNGKLICRLCLGNKWWNGSNWQDTKTNFDMPIGDEEHGEQRGKGKIIDNRVLNGPYNSYEGYGAAVGNNMGGTIEFHIVGVVLDNAHGRTPEVEITNMEIKFVRMKEYAPFNDHTENIYSDETNRAFDKEMQTELIFASDNGNAFGLGIIMNEDGTYCQTIGYSNQYAYETERPEEHLLTRMKRYGMATKKKETINILSNMATVTPYTIITTANMIGYPISISRHWRDDITTLKIIEK